MKEYLLESLSLFCELNAQKHKECGKAIYSEVGCVPNVLVENQAKMFYFVSSHQVTLSDISGESFRCLVACYR